MSRWTASICTHGVNDHWDGVTQLPQRRIRLAPFLAAGKMDQYVRAATEIKLPVEFDVKDQSFYCTWSNWPLVKQSWLGWAGSIREEFSPTFLHKLIEFEKQIQPEQLIPLEELAQKLGAELWNKMHPYQRYGVQFMASRKKSLMSDDMGCGKTMQAIGTAAYFMALGEGPVLITCPKVLQYNWKVEIERWLNRTDVWLVESTKDFVSHRFGNPAGFIVVSHQLFLQKKVIEELTRKPTVAEMESDPEAAQKIRPFPIVIVDESHKIKKRDGKLSRMLVYHIVQPAKVVMLMSGTPSSKAHELWTTVYSMLPHLYSQFFHYKKNRPNVPLAEQETFAERYCKLEQIWAPGRGGGTAWNFGGFENAVELHAILSLFMIRRVKERAIAKLCGQVRQMYTLKPPTSAQQKQLKEWLEKAKPKPLPNAPDIKQVNQTAFMKAYMETANIKVHVVREFMNDHLIPNVLQQEEGASHEKILIFFTHLVMRDMLSEVLTEAKIGHFSISGETKGADRIRYQQSFQDEKDFTYQVALLSIEAAGVGLDFTRSNQVYFAEFNFSVDSLEQATARVVRMNQKRNVLITYLLQPHTTDDIAWSILRAKKRGSSKTLDGESKELSVKRVEIPSSKHTNMNTTMDDDTCYGDEDYEPVETECVRFVFNE